MSTESPNPTVNSTAVNAERLAADIRRWGLDFGFQQIGFADTDLAAAEARLDEWLAKGRHGEMAYMERHGS
jgi:epoxyqueuosine reductase